MFSNELKSCQNRQEELFTFHHGPSKGGMPRAPERVNVTRRPWLALVSSRLASLLRKLMVYMEKGPILLGKIREEKTWRVSI